MKNIMLLFLLLFSEPLIAQQWQWYLEMGSPGYDLALSAIDSDGNIYVSVNYGNPNCYLQKYSPDGDTLWVNQINNGLNSSAGISDLVIDKNNYIYITGSFYLKAVFGNDTLISTNVDTFIAKYSSDGTCLWVRQVGGLSSEGIDALAIDENSNIFVNGKNSDTAFFGSLSIPPSGFLAKYDSTGTCLWVKKITDKVPGYETTVPFRAMKVINNKLFLTGTEWADTFSIDTLNFSHPGQYGHALCCFDLQGNIEWVEEGISRMSYSAYKIGSDNDNNIYVTGNFLDSINFSGEVLQVKNTQPSNHGTYGIFIAKYDFSGNLIFARYPPIVYYPGLLAGNSNSIDTDSIGNFYITGCFNGIAAFGPDTIVSETFSDFFLARFNPDGDCYGAITFAAGEGNSVDVDPEGNPFVAGVIGLPSAMEQMDVFIAKGSPITGIERKSSINNRLIIYANPNEGKCNIELPQDFLNEKSLTLSIFNHQGQLIQTAAIDNQPGRIMVDIQAEAKGIYNVTLSNGKKSYTGKIIFVK